MSWREDWNDYVVLGILAVEYFIVIWLIGY